MVAFHCTEFARGVARHKSHAQEVILQPVVRELLAPEWSRKWCRARLLRQAHLAWPSYAPSGT